MQTMGDMQNRTGTAAVDAGGAAPADANADPSADPNADPGADGSTASPEEQALYDKVMTAALAQLYGNDATHSAIVKALKDGAQNIAQAIGTLTANLIRSIMGNAEKEGGVQLDPDILQHAGLEIVAELIDIAASMKLCKPDDEALFKKAALYATKAFGEALQKEGRVSPEMQAGAKQMMQQGVAAEQAQGKGAPAPPPQGVARAALQGDVAQGGAA